MRVNGDAAFGDYYEYTFFVPVTSLDTKKRLYGHKVTSLSMLVCLSSLITRSLIQKCFVNGNFFEKFSVLDII